MSLHILRKYFMSCDRDFNRYLDYVSTDNRVADVFGTPERAKAALSVIYTATNNRAAREQWASNASQVTSAIASAMLLFGGMKAAPVQPPFKTPTHTAHGLPTPQTAFGYGEVYRVLQACRTNTMPPNSATNWLVANPTAEQSFIDMVDDGKKHSLSGYQDGTFYIDQAAYTPVIHEVDEYRSSVGDFNVAPLPAKQPPLAQVSIESYDTTSNNSQGFSGSRMIDEDGHVWGMIGTQDIDDYYYQGVVSFNPKPPRTEVDRARDILGHTIKTIEDDGFYDPFLDELLQARNEALTSGNADLLNDLIGSRVPDNIMAKPRNTTPWGQSNYARTVDESFLWYVADHGDFAPDKSQATATGLSPANTARLQQYASTMLYAASTLLQRAEDLTLAPPNASP